MVGLVLLKGVMYWKSFGNTDLCESNIAGFGYFCECALYLLQIMQSEITVDRDCLALMIRESLSC